MLLKFHPRRLLLTALILSSLAASTLTRAGSGEGVPKLPAEVGPFRAQAGRVSSTAEFGEIQPDAFRVIGSAGRNYVGDGGEKFSVEVMKTGSASAAYSLLRYLAGDDMNARVKRVEGPGVIGMVSPGQITFIKGDTLVNVSGTSEQANSPDSLLAFAKLFAGTLEGVAGDIPILVLHLPEWEKKLNETHGYAVTLSALQETAGNSPALDALSFDGGAEAVTAKYGDARLVIVEFNTPQYAEENDRKINERIAQLRTEGQPVPSAYKRVGNYSVFVFDAPDAAAAEQLLAGVKYEKDVRWLGKNPHEDEIVQKIYTNTMASVIVNVLKTTGLAIILCLGVGALLGGAVFMRRRARASTGEVFSDAGGMVRLDLIKDVRAPPANLLGRGKE